MSRQMLLTNALHQQNKEKFTKFAKNIRKLKLNLPFCKTCALGKKKLANMITDLLLKNDDDDIESLKKNKEIIPFSENEAIALIEDVKLTKYQYEIIR